MKTRRERLREWLDTVPSETIKAIALECIDNLIDFEYIGFYEDTEVPYWDNTGDRLDGSHYEEQDYD